MTLPANIRVVAIDLDHTMLTSTFELPDKVAYQVSRVAETGVCVVLATGRMPRAVMQYSGALGGAARYLIAYNGAVIVDLHDGSLLSSTPIEAQPVTRLADHADALGHRTVFFFGDRVFATAPDPTADQVLAFYARRTGAKIDTVRGAREARLGPWHKVFFYHVHLSEHYDPEKESPYEQAVFEELARLGVSEVAVQKTRLGYVECTNKRATKMLALRHVLNQHGWSDEHLMAIGDGYNDLEIVASARVGVAVANAIPAVRAAASLVVASNDAGGVAEALKEIFPPRSRRGT
jgi:Cof subfamily protein (haloacid dehalogenase superfamily)